MRSLGRSQKAWPDKKSKLAITLHRTLSLSLVDGSVFYRRETTFEGWDDYRLSGKRRLQPILSLCVVTSIWPSTCPDILRCILIPGSSLRTKCHLSSHHQSHSSSVSPSFHFSIRSNFSFAQFFLFHSFIFPIFSFIPFLKRCMFSYSRSMLIRSRFFLIGSTLDRFIRFKSVPSIQYRISSPLIRSNDFIFLLILILSHIDIFKQYRIIIPVFIPSCVSFIVA